MRLRAGRLSPTRARQAVCGYDTNDRILLNDTTTFEATLTGAVRTRIMATLNTTFA